PQVGSPCALADPDSERRLRAAAARGGHTLYIPRGALWGCEDIARMDSAGTLQALKVTMTKAPGSGPLRPLCPLVPNNVNTMAAAALAAPQLGFDGVTACLVADPRWGHCHLSVTCVTFCVICVTLSVTCVTI
ncbi:aspartate dehydrogenase domain-containing protein, partial [Malurus melanocephalus]|uniref:aspartate dehydrogenase domain-containing protein n=1 Tax=Malurus melanocephalus TaxID=175006 RepID=UPI002548FED8